MDFTSQRRFEVYLRAGEHILWSGRPQQGLKFYARDLYLVPVSLIWGGFVIFWERTVLGAGAPLFFVLWGVPFVLVGLFMIFGRFAVDAWIRSRTLYALTESRALVLRQVTGEKITSVSLTTLSSVQYSPGQNGRGTIDFESAGRRGWSSFFGGQRSFSRSFAMWVPALDGTAFTGVEEAAAAYRLVESARAPAAGT